MSIFVDATKAYGYDGAGLHVYEGIWNQGA
jgi:hypothetical protein